MPSKNQRAIHKHQYHFDYFNLKCCPNKINTLRKFLIFIQIPTSLALSMGIAAQHQPKTHSLPFHSFVSLSLFCIWFSFQAMISVLIFHTNLCLQLERTQSNKIHFTRTMGNSHSNGIYQCDQSSHIFYEFVRCCYCLFLHRQKTRSSKQRQKTYYSDRKSIA